MKIIQPHSFFLCEARFECHWYTSWSSSALVFTWIDCKALRNSKFHSKKLMIISFTIFESLWQRSQTKLSYIFFVVYLACQLENWQSIEDDTWTHEWHCFLQNCKYFESNTKYNEPRMVFNLNSKLNIRTHSANFDERRMTNDNNGSTDMNSV